MVRLIVCWFVHLISFCCCRCCCFLLSLFLSFSLFRSVCALCAQYKFCVHWMFAHSRWWNQRGTNGTWFKKPNKQRLWHPPSSVEAENLELSRHSRLQDAPTHSTIPTRRLDDKSISSFSYASPQQFEQSTFASKWRSQFNDDGQLTDKSNRQQFRTSR